jgi:hypothetical protein
MGCQTLHIKRVIRVTTFPKYTARPLYPYLGCCCVNTKFYDDTFSKNGGLKGQVVRGGRAVYFDTDKMRGTYIFTNVDGMIYIFAFKNPSPYSAEVRDMYKSISIVSPVITRIFYRNVLP